MKVKDGDIIEFQLPVRDDVLYNKGEYIDPRSKVHIFVNGKSMCKRYNILTNYYETIDKDKEYLLSHPEYLCKICYEMYLREIKK